MRANECPECRWVAVVDTDGRRRLEMRWQPSTARTQGQVVGVARAA
jgi:hypothetical protein